MKALDILKNVAPKLEVGTRQRDKVSGWEGTLTAVYVYMNGCVRVELAGTNDKGAPESYVFDHEQIEPVKDAPKVESKAVPSGGPRDSTPVSR